MVKDKIGVLIVESEVVAQQRLLRAIKSSPLVSFVEVAMDTDEAILKVIDLNPDIVFLEYPVKGMTGKGFIRFIQSRLPETTFVFISKTIEFAVEAIQYEIFNYLIKPVKKTEITQILSKVHKKKEMNLLYRINEIVHNKPEEIRLRFSTAKGFIIIDPNDIVYCKADGHFTEIHLANANKRRESVFILLMKIEEVLVPYNFIRISRSVLVNRNYIRKVFRGTNTLVLSANGVEYELQAAKNRIKELS